MYLLAAKLISLHRLNLTSCTVMADFRIFKLSILTIVSRLSHFAQVDSPPNFSNVQTLNVTIEYFYHERTPCRNLLISYNFSKIQTLVVWKFLYSYDRLSFTLTFGSLLSKRPFLKKTLSLPPRNFFNSFSFTCVFTCV